MLPTRGSLRPESDFPLIQRKREADHPEHLGCPPSGILPAIITARHAFVLESGALTPPRCLDDSSCPSGRTVPERGVLVSEPANTIEYYRSPRIRCCRAHGRARTRIVNARELWRPAYEDLRGRKPRFGVHRRRGGSGYGDLKNGIHSESRERVTFRTEVAKRWRRALSRRSGRFSWDFSYARQLRGNVFGLTVSLLKLSDKVNEPGGDRLCQIVLCTEISSDGRLNLNKWSVPHRQISARCRSACSPCCCDCLSGLRVYRGDPSSDCKVYSICGTEPAFRVSKHAGCSRSLVVVVVHEVISPSLGLTCVN